MKNSKKGFTLIELLIVIAIIGLLASIVLVGLGGARRSGRDARRISDLANLRTVLERYYSKCGRYPLTKADGSGPYLGSTGCPDLTVAAPGFVANPPWGSFRLAIDSPGIIDPADPFPQDPSAGSDADPKSYQYGVNIAVGSEGADYVLRAVLDDASNPALDSDVDGTVNTIDCEETTQPNYCITGR